MPRHVKERKIDPVIDFLYSSITWPVAAALWVDMRFWAMLRYLRETPIKTILEEAVAFLLIMLLLTGPPVLLAVGIILNF